MPEARVGSVSYHYQIVGQGPPLVLISGYACDYQFWLPIRERLAQRFTLLLFDNRGVGQTRDDGSPLTVESLADDTVALARQVGLASARVVGHSLGGSVAQAVAARHPAFVERLGLVTTSARWSRLACRALRSLLRLRQAAVDPELVADATMPWLFGETFLAQEEAAEAFKQQALAHPVLQSEADQARQLRALELFDGRQQLAEIRASTLVLWAVEDLVAPEEAALTLARGLGQAVLAELPCGHAVTAEAPGLVAERLLAGL